jgi:hypothetical protein
MGLNVLSASVIMGIGIAIYFLSAVLPGAFDNFFATDTSGWDAGTASLWVLIPLAAIALVVLGLVGKMGGGGKGA